jgi:hypothetical protein
MPRIDDQAFIGWRGRLHEGVRRIASLPPRTGRNGEAWVMDGWVTNPEPIVTSREFATMVDAETTLAAYRAMMDGSTRTAVDPLGRTFNVKVKKVVGDPSVTPTRTVKLIAVWTLQVEAAP